MDSCELSLNNQLCFRLYALSRKITCMYRDLLEDLDITYPQYLVMLVLWEKDRLSVKALGEKLFLDSGTLTPLLKRLETKNLLRRTRSAEDERSVIISLTTDGVNLKEHALCVPGEIQKDTGLTKKEYVELQRMLDGIMNKIT